MPQSLDPIPWVNVEALSGLGTLGLVAGMMLFLYWLFASGRVLTRSQVQRMLDAQDKYNNKQDDTITQQQDTIASLLEANRVLRTQNSTLIDTTRTSRDFFAKVPVTGQVNLVKGDSDESAP